MQGGGCSSSQPSGEGGVVMPEKEGRKEGRERKGDRMGTGGEKIEDRERMEGQ